MARVLAIVPDLMLGSRVEGMLARRRARGRRSSPSLAEAPLDEAELIVADLDVGEPGGAGRAGGAGARLLLARRRRDPARWPRRPGSTWSCRARGWRASCRSWSKACSRRGSKAARRQRARAGRARGPSAPRRGGPRGSNGAGRRSGREDPQLGRLFGAVEGRDRPRAGRRGPRRGARRRSRSRGSSRATTASTRSGSSSIVLREVVEDQLGVGRGAVFVDLEDADRDALARAAPPPRRSRSRWRRRPCRRPARRPR